MVVFSCDSCGDAIKKAKVAQHLFRCRNARLICVDCGNHFDSISYSTHTSCITEAEKYQGPLYRRPNQNKKQGKQQQQQQQNPNPNNQQNSNQKNEAREDSTPKGTKRKLSKDEDNKETEQMENKKQKGKKDKSHNNGETAKKLKLHHHETKSEGKSETEENAIDTGNGADSESHWKELGRQIVQSKTYTSCLHQVITETLQKADNNEMSLKELKKRVRQAFTKTLATYLPCKLARELKTWEDVAVKKKIVRLKQ